MEGRGFVSEAMENLVSAALKPISEAAPTGESARYDDSFDALRTEVEKLSSVSVADIDWNKVVSVSAEILEKRSKDLLVASYLSRGLFQVGGYAALADGLEVLGKLIGTYWDGLFPERVKARASALEWLSERLAAAVQQRDPAASDRESLQACLEKLKGIDGLLAEKLAGDAPSLGDFSGALEEHLAELAEPAAPAPGPAPAGQPAPAPAAAARAVVATTVEPDMSTSEGLERAVNKALSTLRDAATSMRRGNPLDPVPYRLARFAAWVQLSSLPSHTEGRTQVPPLGASPGLVERYEGMASQGQWADLLDEAETQFEQSVFWIDAQHYVVRALEGLGPAYESALKAVRADLASLVQRFPGLTDLRFSNETPFASDEARAWIAEEILAGAEGGGSPTPASGALIEEEDEPFDKVIEHAKQLAGKRKINEAVGRLWAAADRAGSRRQRFLRRLATARFLAEAKEHKLAVALLESLEEESRRHDLEEWEPTLCGEVLRLYLVSQRLMLRSEWKSNPEAQQKAEMLFSRLARLDAAAAMQIGTK